MPDASQSSRGLRGWLDARTGYRAALRVLLDEPLPAGVNWWFTLGSVLIFLLIVQFLTGAVLTVYYVPTPDHAYDSVRFITSQIRYGAIVRSLHFFGASFMVVAAIVHLLRVIVFGAYKAPREATWWSGVVLLLVILAFALSGYLLPWDQRAYWATVVTLNIAGSAPLLGGFVAAFLRGGPALGALTLSRWYAAHVIVLPAAVFLFTVAHLALLRRHHIAGPAIPRPGPATPFFPYHAIKDTVVVALVFAALLTLAVVWRAPLDAIADPADASYVPRPEWYFLGLFQLLKYFPGPFEPVATIGIPSLIVLSLILLPFLDRGPDRRVARRRGVVVGAGAATAAAVALTALGLRDMPATAKRDEWGPRAIAGQTVASTEKCARCHSSGGVGPVFAHGHFARDDQWILGHVADPEMIVPGLRPRQPGALSAMQTQAVIAYVHKLRSGAAPPDVSAEQRATYTLLAIRCASCHVIVDGEGGGTDGPKLTHIGSKRSLEWLINWIEDPEGVDPNATMPAFGDKLTPEELHGIATYLAARK
jgi:quinol-cytochrome oxidoreductase complex cytochrome b subunit